MKVYFAGPLPLYKIRRAHNQCASPILERWWVYSGLASWNLRQSQEQNQTHRDESHWSLGIWLTPLAAKRKMPSWEQWAQGTRGQLWLHQEGDWQGSSRLPEP